jgi:hypothetical protein
MGRALRDHAGIRLRGRDADPKALRDIGMTQTAVAIRWTI